VMQGDAGKCQKTHHIARFIGTQLALGKVAEGLAEIYSGCV